MTTEHSPHAQAAAPEPVDDVDDSTSSDLNRFGIVSHQHTTYEWNGYRYSNSSDAIAAAKRAAR
ncbi:MAG: hypothetical protein M3428_02835 [Pseudomonadota bacterium]|nr:hypothetical protein [Pseudomonadota bacterium]